MKVVHIVLAALLLLALFVIVACMGWVTLSDKFPHNLGLSLFALFCIVYAWPIVTRQSP